MKNEIDQAIGRLTARIGKAYEEQPALAHAVLELTQARQNVPAEPRELLVEAGVLLARAGLVWLTS